jgi:hypothetical protein
MSTKKNKKTTPSQGGEKEENKEVDYFTSPELRVKWKDNKEELQILLREERELEDGQLEFWLQRTFVGSPKLVPCLGL